eukprot:TRINITY_DN5171_c0_g1_i7.p2 TRINITY_DN5171_c0_g1~~TRINITY_DN5171_c0_g1_i7.p2  ORF type:complete len:250 (-),score=25.60 TRINITY_DN5171_c0_g1_i7:593-1342(-)
MSHTPMKDLVNLYKHKTILISGRNKVKSIASSYGFQSTLTTQELGSFFPSATPLSSYEKAFSKQWNGDQISAIMVMNEPDDWYRDFQLIIDIIRGNGVPGKLDPPPHTIPIYFSNPDLVWANDFPLPRFGQGAFSTALNTLYQEVTGKPLQNQYYYGKPNAAPYQLAERILIKESEMLGCKGVGQIYAVGDNPAADIRGANRAGDRWTSVLVRTGVFQGSAENCSVDPAKIVSNDVLSAIRFILQKHKL